MAQHISLAAFDQKATKGEHLNVVFFGGSLTWGANSTDPQMFSYRALIGEKLRDHYPAAHFHFWDAAIGGTGSQLGIFRLDRDVLSHKPDLVFLEFTVNDIPQSEERLASYEAVVRRTIDAKCPVMIVLLPLRSEIGHRPSVQHLAHETIADAYKCPWVDVTTYVDRQVKAGKIRLDDIWPDPKDGPHPSDTGYKIYADAIWESFQDAVKDPKDAASPPEMLHASTYLHTVREKLATIKLLPAGWTTGLPDRTAANYDWLMSRWLDTIVIVNASNGLVKPLELRFSGASVLLFGEATPKSGKFRVSVEGQPSIFKDGTEAGLFDASSTRFGNGNAFLLRVVAQALNEDSVHDLKIEPILNAGEELRIESICIAGKAPSLQR